MDVQEHFFNVSTNIGTRWDVDVLLWVDHEPDPAVPVAVVPVRRIGADPVLVMMYVDPAYRGGFWPTMVAGVHAHWPRLFHHGQLSPAALVLASREGWDRHPSITATPDILWTEEKAQEVSDWGGTRLEFFHAEWMKTQSEGN